MGAYEEIIKLKELHDAKIITDAEFNQLKSNIISNESPTSTITENKPNIRPAVKESPINKQYSKTECASCQSKIGFSNRLKLNDGAYVCIKCIKKAGFNNVLISPADTKYLLHNLTLDTLFNDHSARTFSGLSCPKCGSQDVQFMQQNKKGFSIGKAAAGGLLTGGVGTLAGFAGKKGKKEWFCQTCNKSFVTKK